MAVGHPETNFLLDVLSLLIGIWVVGVLLFEACRGIGEDLN